MSKKILINTPFITLGSFLKLADLVLSGGEAKGFLQSHNVKVNDVIERRRGRKLFNNDVVNVTDEEFIVCTLNN